MSESTKRASGIIVSIAIVIVNIITFATGNIIFAGIGIIIAAIGVFCALMLAKSVKAIDKAAHTLAYGSLSGSASNDTGCFKSIHQSIEHARLRMSSALRDIQHLGHSSVRGHLTVRGDLKYGGEFDEAIEAVNEVISALQMCYDSMRHPMQVLDTNIRCIHINPTIISYGYSQNDVGKTMAQMYSQELHNKYIECYKEIATTHKPYLMRTETPTDLGIIIEENFIWPIFSKGEIVAYGNQTLDITDSVRFREMTEKIIQYQNNEAASVISALENRRKGGLRFDYMPAPYDSDTQSSYESFDQIREMVSFSVGATKAYVDDIVGALQKMASNDFDFEITKEYMGDFAPIKESIETVVASVSKLMQNIQRTSTLVEISSNEIAKEEAHMAEGFRQQASFVQEVSQILCDFSDKIMQNADDAQSVKLLSLEVKQTAEEGNISMQNLSSAMEEIKQSSGEIAKVAKLVENIAFQITLLSLDASIEAARAGKAGAGFAVVANEVRNLAERSTKAAKEAAEMVDTSIANIDKGYTLATQTADVLSKIVNISMNESDGLLSIVDESDKLVHGISTILEKISSISEMISEDLDIVSQNAEACQSLADLAIQLSERISQFKVGLPMIRPRTIWTEATATSRGLNILKNASNGKKTFGAGEIIIREGDTNSDCMYFVLNGTVDVVKALGKPTETILATLNPGDLFGEISLFLSEPRTATVIAKENVTLLEIKKKDMYSFMDSNPDVAYAIAETLSIRLRNMLVLLEAY